MLVSGSILLVLWGHNYPEEILTDNYKLSDDRTDDHHYNKNSAD